MDEKLRFGVDSHSPILDVSRLVEPDHSVCASVTMSRMCCIASSILQHK